MREQPNIATRGIPFELALAFEWDNALIVADTRKDYGERRFQAIGLIAGRVHVLVFTPRSGKTHVISLRKANNREVRQYEAQANPHGRNAKESSLKPSSFCP
jgi:hypothetical protein